MAAARACPEPKRFEEFLSDSEDQKDCCASPPPAASTMANPPSSAGSSMIRAASMTISWNRSRKRRSVVTPGTIDFSLFTDGFALSANKASPSMWLTVTFATPRRKFIIADTPGHEQYTRNMVTGASTAELAIVLVDARKGLLDAIAPARLYRRPSGDRTSRGCGEQDGPGRLSTRSVFDRHRSRFPSDPTRFPAIETTSFPSARWPAITRHPEQEYALVPRPERSWNISKPFLWASHLRNVAFRFPVQRVVRRTSSSAAMPEPSPPAPFGPATPSPYCLPAAKPPSRASLLTTEFGPSRSRPICHPHSRSGDRSKPRRHDCCVRQDSVQIARVEATLVWLNETAGADREALSTQEGVASGLGHPETS